MPWHRTCMRRTLVLTLELVRRGRADPKVARRPRTLVRASRALFAAENLLEPCFPMELSKVIVKLV